MALALLEIGPVAGHVVEGRRHGGKVGGGPLQPDDQGPVVFCRHPQGGQVRLPVVNGPGPLDEEQVVGVGRGGVRVETTLDGKAEVVGGHGGAVAPAGVFPQVEGVLRLGAVTLPALRHPGNGHPVLVQPAEALKQGADHQPGRGAGSRLGVQAAHRPRQGTDQFPVLLVPAAHSGEQKAKAQQQADQAFSHGVPSHKSSVSFSIHSPDRSIVPKEKNLLRRASFPSLYLTGKRAEKSALFPGFFPGPPVY